MNLYSFSVISFSFGVLLTAINCLVKRRDKVTVSFLLFSLSIWGWGTLFSFWINQGYSAETTLLFVRLSYLFVVFIPSTWIYFVFKFIDKKEPLKGFYLLNFGLSAVLAPLCFTQAMFTGVHPLLRFKYLPTPGIMHHVHLTHYLVVVFYALMVLSRVYYQSDEARKKQLRYFVWAILISFPAGTTIYFCFYSIPVPPYLLALLPVYPLLTGIALTKYGLFDVREIADAFQREKMAAVGMLAASLNHELRNNLYVAKGRVEIYKDGVSRNVYSTHEARLSAADKAIEIISGQIEAMGGIIRRFTDFAKPFNTRKDKQKFFVTELLAEVKEMVTFELQSSNVKLEESVPEGISLFANRRQLEEVLINLILNACQAIKLGRQEAGADITKEGEIRICAEEKSGKVKISIADNGPGMERERVEKIFEPFFTTKQEGTGLGLYITKQLVEKNGGEISVQSSIGTGTCFCLSWSN